MKAVTNPLVRSRFSRLSVRSRHYIASLTRVPAPCVCMWVCDIDSGRLHPSVVVSRYQWLFAHATGSSDKANDAWWVSAGRTDRTHLACHYILRNTAARASEKKKSCVVRTPPQVSSVRLPVTLSRNFSSTLESSDHHIILGKIFRMTKRMIQILI